MPSLALKLMACVIAFGIAVAVAVPADAAPARKHKKIVAVQTAKPAQSKYWGTDFVRAGPLYHGQDYLGDDPDPNIRFQILRDLSGRYGGDGN